MSILAYLAKSLQMLLKKVCVMKKLPFFIAQKNEPIWIKNSWIDIKFENLSQFRRKMCYFVY